jgi:hypothetical protein
MNQQLRHIRPVRLVFRLVCDQLHRSNDPVLRIDAGKHQPLASRDAFGNTAPESTGLVEAKGSIKLTDAPPFTQFSRIPASASRWMRISSRVRVLICSEVFIVFPYVEYAHFAFNNLLTQAVRT